MKPVRQGENPWVSIYPLKRLIAEWRRDPRQPYHACAEALEQVLVWSPRKDEDGIEPAAPPPQWPSPSS